MPNAAFELKRWVCLPSDMTGTEQGALLQLFTVSPLTQFRLSGRWLRLQYDARAVQWPQIHSLLDQANLIGRMPWPYRWLRTWYSYVDDNARAHAGSTTAHCCNKPPVVLRKRS